VILCGIQPSWRGRAEGWTLSSPAATARHWGRMLGPAIETLDRAHAAGYRRIEAVVDGEHAEGLRWVTRLGFEVESLMEAYDPNGRDCFMCKRISG
jgi:ribosomal protein S18 acetylase RimI-like enzyme